MKTSHMRPVAIDLFAGAGGLSLGLEQAGFDVVAAVEIDPVHAAVHKFNFPKCAVIPRSISDISGDEIRAAAGIGSGSVALVAGGAPCQGFSMIGKRAMDDPRNSLVREFVRIVRELNAEYFLFENVRGLTLGNHRQFLNEIIEEFEAAGYQVKRDWQVLNAYSYGVPQDRQRLFLLGARVGLKLPDYPAPLFCKPGMKSHLPSAPTCVDALGDLPNAEIFSSLVASDEVRTTKWGRPSSYASKLRCESKADWHAGYERRWDPTLLTSSMRSDHSEISRERFANTLQGEVEPISRFLKLAETGISNTLRAGTDSARGAFTSPRPIHYKWNRCITVREMARLHGFPDWFRFNATKWHGARQIGNSVPPPLARSVASAVLEAMGLTATSPGIALPLGDPSLLSMGMKQAAALWNIPAPIAQRNRESSYRKKIQKPVTRRQLKLLEPSAPKYQ